MPDQLNKQSLVNLLIDSPLREPIKINLIDIVNNTTEPDLPKVYPTIVKELEIFQKATERRMKLADETIAKLGGTNPKGEDNLPTSAPQTQVATPTPAVPPLDLPPLPSTPPTTLDNGNTALPTSPAPLSVPPLDLPPLPTLPSTPTMPEPPVAPMPTTPQPPVTAPTPTETMDNGNTATPQPPTPSLPNLEPLGGATSSTSDEDALAEIQKELESLKAGVASDAAPAQAPVAPPQA